MTSKQKPNLKGQQGPMFSVTMIIAGVIIMIILARIIIPTILGAEDATSGCTMLQNVMAELLDVEMC